MQRGLLEEMKACTGEPSNIYRTLKKIQAGVFRIGFNLWDIFRKLDTERRGYTPEPKFLSVLNGPLRKLIGLNDEEILTVGSLFKNTDGTINYEQFCHLIHDYKPPPTTLEEYEKDDPNRYNDNLTRSEERLLYKTLMTIATTVTKKKLLLKPFFQDYEMIKKHSGLVTRTTFYKVLDFMGVKLSKNIAEILVKRYMRDGYTIKYNAFLTELDEVFHYLEKHNYIDPNGKLWEPDQLPLYEKPAPEGPEYGLRQVFLDSWTKKSKVDPREVVNIILKIKQHICKNKIRIREFFREYDTKGTERVDVSDFVMGLRWLAYGRIDLCNLFLNGKEIDILLDIYEDPINPERKLWKIFEEDIEGDMDQEALERWPQTPLDVPSQRIEDRYERPSSLVGQKPCETFDSMMYGFKFREERCHVNYELAFLRFDRENVGTVSTDHFIEAMTTIPVFLTDREFEWITERYMERTGKINWKMFINDIDRFPTTIIDTKKMEDDKKRMQEKALLDKEMKTRECNIVEILAKINTMMRCYKARIADFLTPFDPNKTGLITKEDFVKGLKMKDLKLTETEYSVILDVFQKQDDENLIEYEKMIRTIDEKSIRPCLVRPPLKKAMKKAAAARAKEPPEFQYLNFNERQLVSLAMKKLSRKVTLGNLDYFKSLDAEGKGLIDRYTFLHAMFTIDVLHMISIRELDIIMKSFGIKDEYDGILLSYTDFLNALDIVFKNQKAAEAV